MSRFEKIFLLLLLLFSVSGSAQISDSLVAIVRKYPKNYSSIEPLIYRIKNDFESDRDRAAAAYTWIAHNVSYDLSSLYSLKPYGGIFYYSEWDLKREEKKRKQQLIDKTFKSRKGLCLGYASLYESLCSFLGLKCTIISGYTRSSTKDIGSTDNAKNHSWNAVYFDKEWHLIDVTWGAGKLTSPDTWSYDFDRNYFDANPYLFINRHYPANYNWQLLPNPIDKEDFFAKPLVYDLTKNPDIIISDDNIGKITLYPSQKHIFIHFKKVSKKTDVSYMLGYNQYKIKKMKIDRRENENAVGIIKYHDRNSKVISLINENQIIAEFIVQ